MKLNRLSKLGDRRTVNHLPWLCFVAVLGVIFCAGCQNKSKLPASTNPAGQYTLIGIDGHKVPCAIQHEGHNLDIKGGSFVINADGTCNSKMTFTPPSGTEATREVKASYTQVGSKLTMRWEGAGVTEGALENDTFTMNNEGMALVYRK